VTVTAVDSEANESGPAGTNTGTFRLTRTGTATQLSQPLSVSFALSGSATAGDYAAVAMPATFGANAATIDLTVTPVIDGVLEPAETVVLTLTPGAAYAVGSPSAASVTVTDDPLPQITVTATRPSAIEGGSNGRFVVTRTGSLASGLEVIVVYSGTAANGVDYSLPTTVVFGASESIVTLNVIALADGLVEPDETVIITVLDGALYDLGASTATVTITGS
jgi:hypothetical protein